MLVVYFLFQNEKKDILVYQYTCTFVTVTHFGRTSWHEKNTVSHPQDFDPYKSSLHKTRKQLCIFKSSIDDTPAPAADYYCRIEVLADLGGSENFMPCSFEASSSSKVCADVTSHSSTPASAAETMSLHQALFWAILSMINMRVMACKISEDIANFLSQSDGLTMI